MIVQLNFVVCELIIHMQHVAEIEIGTQTRTRIQALLMKKTFEAVSLTTERLIKRD